jgi:hypothetical protein
MAIDPWQRAAAAMARQWGVDLAYSRPGQAEPRTVRATISAPETGLRFGSSSVTTADVVLHVERAMVELIKAGDQFADDELVYSVIDPRLDAGRVTWVCQCTASAKPSRGALLLAGDTG